MMASRSRQATAVPSSQRRTITSELPPYEQPAFPLSADAQRNLAILTKRHKLDKVRSDLSDAIATVTNSAGDINERLTDKRRRVEKRVEKAGVSASQDRVEGTPKNDGVEEAERALQTMKEKIESMTTRMDESVRRLIDGQESVDSVHTTLAAIASDARDQAPTQASAQPGRSQRRTRQGGGDDEEESEYHEITPTDPAASTQQLPGPSKTFISKLDNWKTRYQNRSLRDRYADQIDYRNFRGMVHAAQYPDEDVPLAPPSEWFREGPPPKPGVTTRSHDNDDNEDEDDDIQISRATTSTKCPITLQEFKEPLTSKKCPHTFEASAIRQMIANSTNRINQQPGARGMVGGERGVQCPVQSCDSLLAAGDLYQDVVISRRIKRLQQAKALQEQDMLEGDDGSQSHSRRKTAVIEDDDDDDAVDVDDIEDDMSDRPTGSTRMKVEPNRTGESG